MSDSIDVGRLNALRADALGQLLKCSGLTVRHVAAGVPIPGSYWGEPEAGLIGNRLYVRPDTPVHSALHEACHFICMDAMRREHLHTDAGGDDEEEDAVCYLQILLAAELDGYSSLQMMSDMDAWGYSFRLGSARAWFKSDAENARRWLKSRALDRPVRVAAFLRSSIFNLLAISSTEWFLCS